MNKNNSYPNNEEFEFRTSIRRVNLDKKCKESLLMDEGFIIEKHQGAKKIMKEPNSIYSYKFGQTLQDLNPYQDRYRCTCGYLRSTINEGITCPICGTKVKYVDDNFKYFGWLKLKPGYKVIHPNLFKSLSAYIGKDIFKNILFAEDKKDKNGHSIKVEPPKNEPFYDLGLLDLEDHIIEILEYYKKPNKMRYYNDIMKNLDKIFISSIPVYTTLLRPYSVDNTSFNFEGTNKLYNMMCKYVTEINNDNVKILRKRKPKNALLYELQMKYMELYDEVEKICASKKGVFRNAFGGRYDFSARSVIVPDPKLRVDEVIVSYYTAVQLLEQSIINILHKSYNMSYSGAYSIWLNACITPSDLVKDIIKNIINTYERGIPILINRNPTINFGSILQMFIIDIHDSYTMSLPLMILPLLAADFDGDVLNILYILNKDFFEAANRILNPRNSMQIDRNDGQMNDAVNHRKDLVVNLITLLDIGRETYSNEEIHKIKLLKSID